jgi:branched-chain amino acid transport system permease protein
MKGVVQDVVDALALGSLFALYSLGIALVFGVMRLVNMGHATLILVASYSLVSLDRFTLAIQIAASVAITVASALLIELIAFRRLRGKDDSAMLVTSFAVVIAGSSLAEMIFGSRSRSVDLGPAFRGHWNVWGIFVPTISVVTIGVAVTLMVGLQVVLTRTRIGLHLRAVALDMEAATLMGVRINRTIGVAFAISGVLAAAAAVMIVGQSGVVTPTSGLNPVVFGLTAAIVGGISSLKGAVLGGFALGAASQVLQAVMPQDVVSYRDAVLFGAVFLLLIVRPNGLIVALRGERI